MLRSITILVAFGLLCSCSSSDPSPSADSLAIQGAADPATIPVVTTSIAPEPASANTGAVASGEPLTPRNETPLVAGRYRTDKVAGPIVPITFDLPLDGLFTLAEEGYLSVQTDAEGDGILVSVTEVDNNLAFTAPTISFDQLGVGGYGESVTERVPPDLLAWFASRPGVTAGAIVDSTVGGHPARSMTYTVGDFEGAAPCYPGEERSCLATLFAPITGLGQVYLVGDSGTLSELHLGGHRFAIDVLDNPQASDIADSLVLAVAPPTTVPDDAQPVPFVGPHHIGDHYYSERSSGGIYLFDGFDGVSTADSRLRTSQLFLEADDGTQFTQVLGAKCLGITDVRNSTWRGILSTSPPPRVSPPMPDDLIAAIADLALLTVVTPAFSIDLGGVTGRAIDVKPVSGEVVVLDRSLGVTPGITTRFVAVPRSDGQGDDLISVMIGSPCEPVLATIRPVSSGR